jgi:hypothetical protein
MHKLVMLWVAMLAIAPAVLPVHAQKLTYRPRRTAAIPERYGGGGNQRGQVRRCQLFGSGDAA